MWHVKFGLFQNKEKNGLISLWLGKNAVKIHCRINEVKISFIFAVAVLLHNAISSSFLGFIHHIFPPFLHSDDEFCFMILLDAAVNADGCVQFDDQ